MTVLVELHGLGKRYGRTWAVREIELAVPAGQRLALLGHNGAGKTTLIKLMLGLIRPDAGTVRINGAPPGDAASPNRRSIGFLPENLALYGAMSGRETLAFYARLKGRGTAECRQLLERVGLIAAADRRVATYSKGMRQRLGLAQALLGAPRLLLLDEPTTGLDPALREVFYAILDQLAAAGTAVLLSSHLLTELEERTDRIAIMAEGRLIAVGDLAALRRRAALPIELRLTVDDQHRAQVMSAFAGLATETPRPGQVVYRCPATDKMPLLRQVAALGPAVTDAAIIEPGLDAVYAAVTGHAAEAAQ